MAVPEGATLTIVGDLHGQFQDLMHIFRSHGLPSPQRPYLFNGDFVDRGDCGVEITLTLFALHQLHPQCATSRGSHPPPPPLLLASLAPGGRPTSRSRSRGTRARTAAQHSRRTHWTARWLVGVSPLPRKPMRCSVELKRRQLRH